MLLKKGDLQINSFKSIIGPQILKHSPNLFVFFYLKDEDLVFLQVEVKFYFIALVQMDFRWIPLIQSGHGTKRFLKLQALRKRNVAR